MRSVRRTAISAVGPFCLFGTIALTAPSFAETPTGPIEAAPITGEVPAIVPPVAASVDQPERELQAVTLDGLVAERLSSDTSDAESECLAVSIYFESKGEPLAGQLAVAQTMLNRANSGGRFPASLCGVVRQPGQFSFVRGGALPAVPRDIQGWRQAVAIASIPRDGLWKDVAPAALFFHAARVSPSWHLTRVAQLGNHIFYR